MKLWTLITIQFAWQTKFMSFRADHWMKYLHLSPLFSSTVINRGFLKNVFTFFQLQLFGYMRTFNLQCSTRPVNYFLPHSLRLQVVVNFSWNDSVSWKKSIRISFFFSFLLNDYQANGQSVSTFYSSKLIPSHGPYFESMVIRSVPLSPNL